MLFSNVFSDMFDDMFDMPTANQNAKGLMNCDVKEYDDHYELDLDMAGFKKGDIKAELKDGYLTITAQASVESDEQAKVSYIHRERYTGSCKRSFYVGEQLRQEDIHAAFTNGVLRLTVPKDAPKAVEEAPKYISIN